MAPPETGDRILVTGAAGKTGRSVIRRLLARGMAVRALVRRAGQRREVEKLGVDQAAEGDLTSRQAVAEAAAGVDGIYHICPNVHPEEVAIGGHVIAAARDAGVRRLVFHSVLHPQVEAMPHHWAKLRVEEQLFESGLPFTILQPAPYMQNLLGEWRSIAEEGVYPVPYDLAARVAMVDLEDVGEAAARVLAEPGHGGATYELCGPDLPDSREIAATLGRVLSRPVRAERVPAQAWAERARASGLDGYAIDTLLAMFSYYGRFGMAGGCGPLEWLLGRPPSRLAEFAERVAAASR